MDFLEISKTTSCFSPVCYFYLIYLMCESNDLGRKMSELGKTKINEVLKIYDVNEEIFKTICCLYTKDYQNEIERKIDGWHIENFNDKNAQRIYEQHVSWFNLKTKGKYLTPIKPGDFEKFNSIYLTVAIFQDDWARKFNRVRSCISHFHESKSEKSERMFLVIEDEFKYNIIKSKNASYHIVALPYITRNGNDYSRYMVYLIPISVQGKYFGNIDFGDNLSIVWKSFCKKHSTIKRAINDLRNKTITLQIPKIYNLQTNFNMIDLISEIFNIDLTDKSISEMTTYLHIYENGTGPINIMDQFLYDSKLRKDLSGVKANVPHISFIFDMDLEKILFITKDLGQNCIGQAEK
ncbi:hypothetical protein NBO_19g0009 [Nosema bombycis CQ1]|uniref:Serpin domain-containing protein n=1 Tax=Nosema bombycis (strain CQ1 / CVCC 102059) TaxID=578461 RepID=R0KUV2_NOSB1|nr:hypothetical protein NBO_19g0009 [Nosema bombycis CQ1]|eukprot:EOB14656.1 hypothetical protein NBO_19g0009 [Nosema bombycis CQ1]